MFNRGFRLPFKLLGIPVILDWSFLLILPLLAYLIGSNVGLIAQQFGLEQAEVLQQTGPRYLIGLIAAIGLFVCVLLHELGHAVAARMYGVEVESITLWFLGGVASMPQIPRQPGAEAVVGIAGPIVSFLLGGLFWLAAGVLGEGPSGLAAGVSFVLIYLAALNIVLAVFNLLPALPLDGGRVLRSLLALAMPHGQATRIAGGISKVLAILLGLIGFLSFNIFLMLIAFFIYMAVSAETQMGRMEDMLRGVKARHMMNPQVKTVSPGMRVSELLKHIIQQRHLGFPVIDDGDGSLRGVVTLEQTHNADPDAEVASIMSTDVPTVGVDDAGMQVMRQMGSNGLNRIVVLDPDGRLAGIITKRDVMRMILVREATAEIMPPDGLRETGTTTSAAASWGARPA